MLKNGVVSSASGFTININGIGAKPVYNNMASSSQESIIFNENYTMLFVYDSSRGTNGGWVCYRGYDAPSVDSLEELTGDLYLGKSTIGTATVASSATVATGLSWDAGSPTYVQSNTVVTGGTTSSITPVTKKTVVTSASGATASYSNGILTITNGSFGTGDSVTTGTAISVYTSLSTGSAVQVTEGYAPSLSYTSTIVPIVTVTTEQVVIGVTSQPSSPNVGSGLVGSSIVG